MIDDMIIIWYIISNRYFYLMFLYWHEGKQQFKMNICKKRDNQGIENQSKNEKLISMLDLLQFPWESHHVDLEKNVQNLQYLYHHTCLVVGGQQPSQNQT